MRQTKKVSPNYKIPELMLMLDVVGESLPLGKEEWERVTAKYNAKKSAEWSERDFESLRRKFKQLCATRKPTGDPFIPPHIRTAKTIKSEIDMKAGVVDLDDDSVEEDRDEGNEVGVDEAYEYPGDEVADDDEGDDGHGNDYFWMPIVDQDSAAAAAFSSFPTGLAAFGSTPLEVEPLTPARLTPAPLYAAHNHSSLRFDIPRSVYPGPTQSALTAGPSLSGATGKSPAKATKAKKTTPEKTGKPAANPKSVYQDSSNRLGGMPLSEHRDSSKRNQGDLEVAEASYTKQKRLRAEGAMATLQKRFQAVESASASSRNDMMQYLMMTREDAERKADLRRGEEERRRRDEMAAKEARDREDREERREERRRDKEEDRVRMQEFLLMMTTLAKK